MVNPQGATDGYVTRFRKTEVKAEVKFPPNVGYKRGAFGRVSNGFFVDGVVARKICDLKTDRCC